VEVNHEMKRKKFVSSLALSSPRSWELLRLNSSRNSRQSLLFIACFPWPGRLVIQTRQRGAVARREILDSDPKPDCPRAKGVTEQLVRFRTSAMNR
jgi:hypothetical protein